MRLLRSVTEGRERPRGLQCCYALIMACLLFCVPGTGICETLPSTLAKFLESQETLAASFAGQAAGCVAKTDTAHPVFHGCVDWHSAVHGIWALIAYSRITNDFRYAPEIHDILNARIDEERSYLAQNANFEMPYGRAWFLRLAIDYKRTFHDDLLSEFADEVASSLVSYFRQHSADPASRDYDSASWALINLYDYASFTGNPDIQSFVESTVSTSLWLGHGETCPELRREMERADFMAVCTNWAWLVAKVLPQQERAKWIASFLPPALIPSPVNNPKTPHHHGQNFSRCWGLWALYAYTGDTRYLDSFLAHFYKNLENYKWWQGDYHTVGHWVAQFGMFALAQASGE